MNLHCILDAAEI